MLLDWSDAGPDTALSLLTDRGVDQDRPNGPKASLKDRVLRLGDAVRRQWALRWGRQAAILNAVAGALSFPFLSLRPEL
jgi:hypothetical protein